MNAPATTIERAAKERGIPFSGPMVRAVLEDRKTQTRRIVKFPGDAARAAPDEIRFVRMQDYPDGSLRAVFELCDELFSVRSPYGRPGDRLYVREGWRVDAAYDAFPPRDVPRNTSLLWLASAPHTEASRERLGWGRYRHARFMPRWASRIDLDVLGVRVERLHDITDKDILAEGVTVPIVAEMTGIPWAEIPDLFSAWRLGWIHINGAESWEANPWCWVVLFRRVQS